MEEAYAQLYQEFVRLRTLCLRQASLLQQLTSALKQQQETNGDICDITSMSDQLDSEYPIYLKSATHPPPPVLTTATLCSTQGPSGNAGHFSNLLAQDMSRLSMDTATFQRNDPKTDLSVPQSLTSQMTLSHGENNVNKHQRLSLNGDSDRRPVPSCPLLGSDALSQHGGAMISDVALQSHVCEFCQAVFPGDTTTRGQYLQHIYTHITS